MPLPYVKKMADKHHLSMTEAEQIWNRAKHESSEPYNYAVIVSIFKKMIGEPATSSFQFNAVKSYNILSKMPR